MSSSLDDLRLVGEDGITGTDRDAAEGGDGLAIEFFNSQQDVGFVHGLKVQIGSNDTVAVDDRTTHVGSDFRGV